MTADGRIADSGGLSRWITGPESRAEVHRLRRRADAILVGARTVIADDPGLLPEGPDPNPVYRVIIDGEGRSPAQAKVFTDAKAADTILCVTHDCPDSKRIRWEANGAAVWGVPSRKGRIVLTEVLRLLGKMGLLHVVCEGGGVLAEGLVREGLVDEFWLFYAPRLLGGRSVPGFGGKGWSLKEAPALTFDSVVRTGEDLWVRAFPVREEAPPCSPD
jgi:diaminohydroxyphosphoribosylaminopyrimidine deaminase/5-amino-6-(5-phosphoribosylamino)uracil reductase